MDKRLQAFERLLDIMDRLREECPWDRKQTFESLRNNTIEESYELVDAIAGGDMGEVCEELGDVLLHVVFYARMGAERGAFDIADVCDRICEKLVYRHPHVFGQVQADTAEQVTRNWEALKQHEKKAERGVLEGVPRSLPAMVKAWRIGQKAAAAGFDWERREDVWDKVREEVGEVEVEMRAADVSAAERLQDEMGDLFFALINAARLYDVDPELALERTNQKFIRRFGAIESAARKRGTALRKMTLAEMEDIWQQSKRTEHGDR